MSGAVDVLRALDKAVFHTGGWPGATFPEVHADLIQARAAVAELIDAAVGFRAITSGDEAGSKGWEAASRLDAALARVQDGDA